MNPDFEEVLEELKSAVPVSEAVNYQESSEDEGSSDSKTAREKLVQEVTERVNAALKGKLAYLEGVVTSLAAMMKEQAEEKQRKKENVSETEEYDFFAAVENSSAKMVNRCNCNAKGI